MTIHVRYFAVLRERRGVEAEAVEIANSTLGSLYAGLREKHALGLPLELVRFAVDGEFVSADTELRDGAEVALIPPVAGG